MPRGRPRRDAATEVTEILAEASAEAPAPKPAPRRRRTSKAGVSEEALQGLHEIVAMSTSVLFLIVAEAYRPTREEIDAVFLPLERIWLRRTGIGEVHPDVQDGLFALLGVMLYAKRVGLLDRKPQFPGLNRAATVRPTPRPAPADAPASGPNGHAGEAARAAGFGSIDDKLAALHGSIGEPIRADGGGALDVAP